MEDKDVLYAKWLNGEISDDKLESLVGAEALVDLKRVVSATDKWSMPKYDASAGYNKFKKNKTVKESKVKQINWYKVSGIAASFLILFFFGTRFLTDSTQVIYAGNGQNENKTLADGSEIWLNDGSTIEFDSEDWKANRTIELSGEAQFEVTKGSPFIVNTPNGSIQVLGTQFNVRAWGPNLYVECYEGKVQVTSNNRKTILTEGEAVNVVQGTMTEKEKITHDAPLWKNSISRFHNELLTDVFEELERQYDVEIKSTILKRSFSGNFRHDNLEDALQSICKPLGLNFLIKEDQKIVEIE